MKNVNRGRLELRTFDPDKDLAAAEAIAASAKNGKDPFAGRTGDFKRHYLLETANEISLQMMVVEFVQVKIAEFVVVDVVREHVVPASKICGPLSPSPACILAEP